MVLSDTDIIERVGCNELTIEPYEESNVEPASVDLRMGDELKAVNTEHSPGTPVELADPSGDEYRYRDVEDMTLMPGELYLASTKERIELPEDLAANVLGRSSLGRLGISVHQTAGFIDPGFSGEITLEITNHGPQWVKLEQGLRICQIVFHELSSAPLQTYGGGDSQYQYQTGPTESGMSFD